MSIQESKVTIEQVEHWLGTDGTFKEAVEVITAIANKEYTPEQLLDGISELEEFRHGS